MENSGSSEQDLELSQEIGKTQIQDDDKQTTGEKKFLENLPENATSFSRGENLPENASQDCKVDHEIEMSEDGEEGLPKKFEECKKYPEHAPFIPIKSFKMEDLPESHRREELFHLIKATADLVVRVAVKMVSEKRPEFWPETQKMYPFYDKRGSSELRTGTGEIVVHKFTDGCGYDVLGSSADLLGQKFETEYKTCPCERCENSDHPSNVWWEVTVATAAHVVFDETEAKATSCRLFFDEKGSPKFIIDKFKLGFVDFKRDVSELTYITCDQNEGEAMHSKVVHWADLWRKVNKNNANRSEDMLTFMVSHPHGSFKHVTIGQCKKIVEIAKINEEMYFTKLSYTTATCPGSSGASVHCLAFGGGHVHAGVTSNRLNLSGVGYYRKSNVM